MTTRAFRTAVVIYALTYGWYVLLAYNSAKLPAEVQTIVSYSGYGAVMAPDSPVYSILTALTFAACFGLLLLARWGRTLLAVATVAGVAAVPFAGISVMVPFDSLLGSIAGTLGPLLLGVAFCEPIAGRLSVRASEEVGRSDPDERERPQPNEPVVEVFRTSDESLLVVLESVLAEHDIPFSLADNNIQDLFAAGRLGGFNFATGPARLFVRESDSARVREILHELTRSEAAVDERT